MKFNYTIIILLIAALSACKSSKDLLKVNKTLETEEGLKVTLLKRTGKGLKIDTNDIIKVNYIGKLSDSTEFDNSYKKGFPVYFELGTGKVIKGWEKGFDMLQEGDSAFLEIPPHLAYGDKKMGKIPATSTLFFTVKIENVKKPVKPFNVAGKDTVFLEDSLYYIIAEQGSGDTIVEDKDRVRVHYTGYFTNGKKFDSSHDRTSTNGFEFLVGKGQVIKAWDKGLIGMKKGEKRRIYAPYQLAYGEQGSPGAIPPKSDLIFDVEVLKIIKTEKAIPFEVEGLDTTTLNSGLQYIKVIANDNRNVKVGDTVEINYTGYFTNGEIFDSSIENGKTLEFRAGMKQVIPGFDEALLNMNEGEKVRFIIPSKLAYGERGVQGIIPPDSDLIFDIHLIEIK